MRYYRIFIAITIAFIFGIVLIFNNYQTFSYSQIILAYKKNSIEKVLVQIPTCTPDDRARQRALLHTLLQWSQLAQEHNIQYWIAYKTLLGYVQRDGLLPHALNLDILVMAQDTSHLAELCTLNFSSNYELKLHPQWFIVEKTKRSYFNQEGIDFVEPNARFINRKDHVHINIWPIQTTTTRLSDEEFIEKILKSVPICESDDRDRQRYLLSMVQAWSHLAEKYNIQYWLSFGTLVGYVQRRGLLPHDLDIDVTMLSSDTPKLIEISKLNFSSTYEIKVQPQWKIVDELKRSYFRKDGINFIAPNARFIHQKTRYHVDIFPAYDFNPTYANESTEMQQSENLTVHDNNYQWLSYPRNWTYPLVTCYFSEIQALCPAEPKKLVETIYGASSLTKSDKKCVNGSWVRNS
ncbi:unnamed protein product [Rotaria socialis]|uniref:LicD/FKTN/FKRP nucleotidyltransferase domain-containing protein n=1 Tax=Rotaria socialis TaxID=392032 RepID=A0A820X7K9_9BILA|nr:unnamed protein product [Rotaria socialis]